MAQRKYIIIGESWLEMRLQGLHAAAATPSGTMLRLAYQLAQNGSKTIFLTELGNDRIGDEIAAYLETAGVDLRCADRYAGLTSLRLVADDQVTRYDIASDSEGFDVAWPRIEKEDVIVFGGYMALDKRVRVRLVQLLEHVAERKATIVYVPDVVDPRIPRITMSMPLVFENLEIANAVVSLPGDLQTLFATEDPSRAYSNNVSFYCRSMATIERRGEKFGACSFGDMKSLSQETETAEDLISALVDL